MAKLSPEELKSLMDRFLASIDGLSDEEAEGTTGINRESIRLYRLGQWTRLTAATQRKMRASIERHGGGFLAVRETSAPYSRSPSAVDSQEPRVVPVDLEGHPVLDDVELIFSWLPEEMSTRWAGTVSYADRLAEVYAYGAKQGWTAERLDFIHQVRASVQALQRRQGPPEG